MMPTTISQIFKNHSTWDLQNPVEMLWIKKCAIQRWRTNFCSSTATEDYAFLLFLAIGEEKDAFHQNTSSCFLWRKIITRRSVTKGSCVWAGVFLDYSYCEQCTSSYKSQIVQQQKKTRGGSSCFGTFSDFPWCVQQESKHTFHVPSPIATLSSIISTSLY